MTELEIVLNGIEEVEKSGLVCGVCGDACHHFPDTLINDIRNLLQKQDKEIQQLRAVCEVKPILTVNGFICGRCGHMLLKDIEHGKMPDRCEKCKSFVGAVI